MTRHAHIPTLGRLDAVLAHAATIDTGANGLIDPDGTRSSWHEVNDLVDELSFGLLEAGVKMGDRVALVHSKSNDSFVAAHAILRSGAVLVPIDPLAAPSTVSNILALTETTLVVADHASCDRLLGVNACPGVHSVLLTDQEPTEADDKRICLSREWKDAPRNAAFPNAASDDPAYILFTSGSTGTPKGIVHTHESGLAYARQAVVAHELTPDARLAGTAPLHFDMSMLELYSVPLSGATAVTIGEAELRFPATLSQRLSRDRVTHLYAVPFILEQLVHRGALTERDLAPLRHIAFAGEPMGSSLLADLMTTFESATFLNAYGPAELNVVTERSFSGSAWDRTDVPIGSPWDGVSIRIVDEDLCDVPYGDAGELWVDAPTRMQGYWRAPEDTSSKFALSDGATWYRTGDVVRQEDNELWFQGRIDNQVKIRGVRLELEAIEAALCLFPSISQAVATRKHAEHGDVYIAAAVVMRNDENLDRADLRAHCRAHLAAAAIPREISVLATMPVSANGKIDRLAAAALLSLTQESDET